MLELLTCICNQLDQYNPDFFFFLSNITANPFVYFFCCCYLLLFLFELLIAIPYECACVHACVCVCVCDSLLFGLFIVFFTACWFVAFLFLQADGWTDIQTRLTDHGFRGSVFFTISVICLGHFLYTNLFIGIIIYVRTVKTIAPQPGSSLGMSIYYTSPLVHTCIADVM